MPAAVQRPPLTPDQQKLVESCINLAKHHAIRWAMYLRGRDKHTIYDELYSAALMGLCIAATKFRPELGFRFTTYGTCWIKQSIARQIDHFHPLGSKLARKVKWEAKYRIGSADDDYNPPARPLKDATRNGPEVDMILKCIPEPRTRDMLKLHVLDGYTFATLGVLFGVSRARAQQLVSRELYRLRLLERVRDIREEVQGEAIVG